ncbi:hypothetical protein BDW75DRAFT_56141 [Aspergillus navahoensis]
MQILLAETQSIQIRILNLLYSPSSSKPYQEALKLASELRRACNANLRLLQSFAPQTPGAMMHSRSRFSTSGPGSFSLPSSLRMPMNRARTIPYITLARAALMRPRFYCHILYPTPPPLALLLQSTFTTFSCRSRPGYLQERPATGHCSNLSGSHPGAGRGCIPSHGSRTPYQALRN